MTGDEEERQQGRDFPGSCVQVFLSNLTREFSPARVSTLSPAVRRQVRIYQAASSKPCVGIYSNRDQNRMTICCMDIHPYMLTIMLGCISKSKATTGRGRTTDQRRTRPQWSAASANRRHDMAARHEKIRSIPSANCPRARATGCCQSYGNNYGLHGF